LLPLPLPGLTLADKQAVNRALLTSGATIAEMNCVRRHLSAIKGGRLAAACHPARVVTLLLSDVPGDDPIDIASGPTTPDPTTCADALDVVRRHGIALPGAVRDALETGRGESPKPGDPRLARAEVHGFFGALGDAVTTGPTLTNVNDFRAILVTGPGAAST
jgi:hydroxypyruvate reductase